MEFDRLDTFNTSYKCGGCHEHSTWKSLDEKELDSAVLYIVWLEQRNSIEAFP